MKDNYSKHYKIEISFFARLSNLYWGWWDLINTSIVVICAAIILILVSLQLMGVLPLNLFNLLPLNKNPELGLGLLGFAASAGSAAGVWILSKCIERWSVINAVIGINNEFLCEFGVVTKNNTQEWKATLSAYTWAVSLLEDKILSLNSRAQKHIYGSLIYSNMLIDCIGNSEPPFTDEASSAHFRRFSTLYVRICLASLYLNGKPRLSPEMFANALDYLRHASGSENIKEVLEEFDAFIPRKKDSHKQKEADASIIMGERSSG